MTKQKHSHANTYLHLPLGVWTGLQCWQHLAMPSTPRCMTDCLLRAIETHTYTPACTYAPSLQFQPVGIYTSIHTHTHTQSETLNVVYNASSTLPRKENTGTEIGIWKWCLTCRLTVWHAVWLNGLLASFLSDRLTDLLHGSLTWWLIMNYLTCPILDWSNNLLTDDWSLVFCLVTLKFKTVCYKPLKWLHFSTLGGGLCFTRLHVTCVISNSRGTVKETTPSLWLACRPT